MSYLSLALLKPIFCDATVGFAINGINVYTELPKVSSFYRVISALRFYWSTFVCDTNITAVNWSLIEL